MKKRVTIYDIAKEVNLSPSTVSRVLSNSKRNVNPEIRKKVEEAAKKMNYYPNTIARSLKTNSNLTIGVILPSIDNPFYPSIVRGMEDEAIINDYSINICSCDRESKRTDKYIERLIGDGVSGIIAIYLDNIPMALVNFIKRGGKVLNIGTISKVDYDNCGIMYFDKEYEAYLATKHLLELGHRNIAMFISSINNNIRKRKINGYKKALLEYGIVDYEKYLFVNNEEINHNEDTIPDCNTGIYCANEMLHNSKEVTGIVCMNDLVALGAISVFKKKGYSIPKDYSIIGFDDTFFSNLIEPQITTLKLDKYQLGQQAVKNLLEMIKGKKEKIQIDCSNSVRLVIRNSTSNPRLT